MTGSLRQRVLALIGIYSELPNPAVRTLCQRLSEALKESSDDDADVTRIVALQQTRQELAISQVALENSRRSARATKEALTTLESERRRGWEQRNKPKRETPEVAGMTAAQALGQRGGLKGGRSRAEKLSAEERKESARKAAQARWAAVRKCGQSE